MLLINLFWNNRLIIMATVYFNTLIHFVKTVHYEKQFVPDYTVVTHYGNVNVIFAGPRPSTMTCASSCFQTEGCGSFCYNNTNHACVGCNESCSGSKTSDSGKFDNFTCWTGNSKVGTNTPRDCQDVLSQNKSATDGVYAITTKAGTNLDVYCIMSKRKGGWTVFLRRFNGEVRFNRTFNEYEAGFGNKASEHWLGLKYIHKMTATTPSDIHISTVGGITVTFEKEVYEEWSTFYIGPGPNYTMHLGALETNTYNTIGDNYKGLKSSYGMEFSTNDVDSDNSTKSCSESHGNGGWWYNNCMTGMNPTGIYMSPGIYDGRAMCNTQYLGYLAMRKMTIMYRKKIAN